MHQFHKVSFIYCFCFSFFSVKIIHQLHKISFIYCCFYSFFQTKSQYSFLSISYIKFLLFIVFFLIFFRQNLNSLSMHHLHKAFFIYQLHKLSFIHCLCFITQNFNTYFTYKWEESRI